MSAEGEEPTGNAGIPEHARLELEDFLALSLGGSEALGEPDTFKEMTMLAKSISLQQAGILPLNHDLGWSVEAAKTQLELEGLLKGY